jgi:hypothetical protein
MRKNLAAPRDRFPPCNFVIVEDSRLAQISLVRVVRIVHNRLLRQAIYMNYLVLLVQQGPRAR